MIARRLGSADAQRWSRAIAAAALLALPIGLLYSRVEAEISIAVVAACFVARCAVCGQWSWLRTPWLVTALVWWLWMVVCSAPVPALGLGQGGGRSLVQALLLIRYFLFAAALGHWLLREAALRRALFVMLGLAAAWIALQCWQQYLLGFNISGDGRWSDGALTGPFWRPRAGPALVLILFPAVLPATSALLQRRSRWYRAGGVALFAFAIATMVLIGQRMPALLTGLGLLTCGIALPRLRQVVLGAAAAGVVLVASLPLISPPTFEKLVVHFADQMHHFPQSPYGQLYTRAAVMGLRHIGTGLGYDGFRHNCAQPQYQRGIAQWGISDAQAAGPAGCSIHPHNHYLEAFTSGGLPGLLLFCAMIGTWLATLGRSIGRGASAERVACATTVLLGVWPFASTSAFFTLPNGGWLFVVFGTAVALTPAARATQRARRAAPRQARIMVPMPPSVNISNKQA